MAILLPTSANVRLLKSILMDQFEMRSAHASEAIASLIGFRSNASYLVLANPHLDSTIYEADFDSFEDRATHLGYDRTSSEYLRHVYAQIEWPEPAWRQIGKQDSRSKDTWFHDCQARRIPFLHVLQARKYCSVHWDHISLDSEYDELVRQRADGELGRILFRTYQLIASGREPKSLFAGSAFVGSVTGLSESSARQVANAFAMLLFPGNVRSALAA